jgi:PKD repeat protein
MKIRLFILVALCAGIALALASSQAHALINVPIPSDVGPTPPPIPTLPEAGATPPPADAIADPINPDARCGGWYRQSSFVGFWPASSTWWEYACSYSYPPPCTGICDQSSSYYVNSTDYFYWDGSKAVHYGELYADSSLDMEFSVSGEGCQFWWDVATAQWYMFDTSACPYSGPGNAAPTASFFSECTGLSCAFDGSYSWASDGIADYSWDFGDGTTGSGVRPQHSYAVKGAYTVTLTVTDSGGLTSVDARTVWTTDIPPTARFTFDCTGLTCHFDGSGSSDPDGTIRYYNWSFGDGYSAHGSSTAANSYYSAGSYTVRLEVVDDQGVSGHSEQTVTVVGTSTDLPPSASFTYSCSGLNCHFDGSSSSDSDGTIISYEWSFGDFTQEIRSASTADHTYGRAGSYSVTLRVTDDGKASASSDTKTVSVTNLAPTASFTFSCTGFTCSFDGRGSSDSDGTISSHRWDFGDGSPLGAGNTTEHTYLQNSSYSVTLTVIDYGGLNGTVTKTVTVGANAPPTAAFTFSCTGQTCSLDGSASVGTIADYSWMFGDGSRDGGKTATHTYAQTGTYTVTLTVTGDAGASSSTSKTVGLISLTTTGYKMKGLQKVDLSWSGPSGSYDVYRNSTMIASVSGVSYTDNLNQKGPGNYVYKVCAVATSVCSNEPTVTF